MLRGIATISFWAADHEAAKAWYSELLGLEPYYDRPGYCEFRLGDHQTELGLIDASYDPDGPTAGPGGVHAFWHVDDLEGSFARLVGLGATVHQPVTPRGEGFVTASVLDPFGNILAIMTNPHYLEMLAA